MTGRVQAKWTNRILDEVEGCEPLIEGLKLPDPDDRHVLAAAIKVGAETIVTSNLKDFPADYLAPMGYQRKVAGRFRTGSDRPGRTSCLGLCAADRGLTEQSAGDR